MKAAKRTNAELSHCTWTRGITAAEVSPYASPKLLMHAYRTALRVAQNMSLRKIRHGA